MLKCEQTWMSWYDLELLCQKPLRKETPHAHSHPQMNFTRGYSAERNSPWVNSWQVQNAHFSGWVTFNLE